jgi:hypothetical protein
MELTKGQALAGLIFAFLIVVLPGEPMWIYLGGLSAVEFYGVLVGNWIVWGIALVLVGVGGSMIIVDFYAGYGFFIAAIGGMLVIVFTPIVFPVFSISI